MSPITGLVQKTVEEPATELTGNPEFGSRLGFVANSLAGPAVGALAGRVAGSVAPEARAVSEIRSALGTVAPDEAARLAANPNLRLMDVNPQLQANALGLANVPGEARNILKAAVDQSRAAAPDVASEAFDAAMGKTPDVKQYLENLEATKQANAKSGYGEALKNAKPVDISPVLQRLDAIEGTQKPGVPQTTAQASASDIKSMLVEALPQEEGAGAGAGAANRPEGLGPAESNPAAADRAPAATQTVLYHGARQPYVQGRKTPLYLTEDPLEAQEFAKGVHLGGEGKNPQIHSFSRLDGGEGAVKNIDDKLGQGMEDGEDPDTIINDEINAAKAQKNGPRFLEFHHPSTLSGDEFKATVSIYPHEDLGYNKTFKNASEISSQVSSSAPKTTAPFQGAPKSSPQRLVVAMKNPDGSIKYGKPGELHSDLGSTLPLGSDAYNKVMGFAQPGGKFMTREESLDFVRRNEPQTNPEEVGLEHFGLEGHSYNQFSKAPAAPPAYPQAVPYDPQKLHEVQSYLRTAADREFQRGDMASGIKARQLTEARQGIIKALDDATGGKYSEARIKYREDSSVEDAFEKGGTFAKNGTLEDRPEYWQAWKNAASPEDIEAAKVGM